MKIFTTIKKYSVTDISLFAVLTYLLYFFVSVTLARASFVNQIHLDILSHRIGISGIDFLKICFWVMPFLSILGFVLFFFNQFKKWSILCFLICLSIYNYSFTILSEVYFEYFGLIFVYLVFFDNSDKSTPSRWKFYFWGLCCLSFSFSGLSKLLTPFWTDSLIIDHLLNAWVSNKSFLQIFNGHFSKLFIQGFVLFVETASFAMFVISPLRKLNWWLGLALHAGAFFVLNLPQVSISMLLVYLFFYDSIQIEKVTHAKNVH